MEKGIACVVMLIPVAGAELSSTAAVGQHCANLGLRQRTSTAVRAATDPNLVNDRSTAVACILSYCCGPVNEKVRVRGGEYRSSQRFCNSIFKGAHLRLRFFERDVLGGNNHRASV